MRRTGSFMGSQWVIEGKVGEAAGAAVDALVAEAVADVSSWGKPTGFVVCVRPVYYDDEHGRVTMSMERSPYDDYAADEDAPPRK